MAGPDLSSPAFKANPYPYYARLRREAPVHHTRLAFWLSARLVTRYADVAAVLRDQERFSNDITGRYWWVPARLRVLNEHLLTSDPPDHMRLRTLVSKAFTPRAVERLRERTQQLCHEILESAALTGRLDVVRDYALRVPLTIVADMLGIPQADRVRFNAWTSRVAAASSGEIFYVLRALPAMREGVSYLHALIAARRTSPGEDLVSALIRAEEAGDRLSEDEIVGMIALLLLAGFETTMSLISLGTLALIQHPDQRRQFCEQPAGLEPAIEELLRYTSPLDAGFFRIAKQELTIAGVRIPRGAVVLPMIGSANHDEEHFERPDELDLARTPNRHIAFGVGAHFCLGAPLARMEGAIALSALFRRFPQVRLAEGPGSVVWRRGLFFRGLERLQLVVRAPLIE